MSGPRTEPGTLDLSVRLPGNAFLRAAVVTARAVCDGLGHPPRIYNPCQEATGCRCGLVWYPGDCAPPLPPPPERPEPKPWAVTP